MVCVAGADDYMLGCRLSIPRIRYTNYSSITAMVQTKLTKKFYTSIDNVWHQVQGIQGNATIECIDGEWGGDKHALYHYRDKLPDQKGNVATTLADAITPQSQTTSTKLINQVGTNKTRTKRSFVERILNNPGTATESEPE